MGLPQRWRPLEAAQVSPRPNPPLLVLIAKRRPSQQQNLWNKLEVELFTDAEQLWLRGKFRIVPWNMY